MLVGARPAVGLGQAVETAQVTEWAVDLGAGRFGGVAVADGDGVDVEAAKPAVRSARIIGSISLYSTSQLMRLRTEISTAPPPSWVPKLAATPPAL